jgi:hypothetical protein
MPLHVRVVLRSSAVQAPASHDRLRAVAPSRNTFTLSVHSFWQAVCCEWPAADLDKLLTWLLAFLLQIVEQGSQRLALLG